MNAMLRYVRRVQKTGPKNGGALYINVPGEWANQHGVMPQDRLVVSIMDDGSLRISLDEEDLLEEGAAK